MVKDVSSKGCQFESLHPVLVHEINNHFHLKISGDQQLQKCSNQYIISKKQAMVKITEIAFYITYHMYMKLYIFHNITFSAISLGHDI